MVERFNDSLMADNALHAESILGDLMQGVYSTWSRREGSPSSMTCWRSTWKDRHLPVLGMIPEDRMTRSITIRELAASLHGEVLSGDEARTTWSKGLSWGPCAGTRHFRLP